MRLYYINPYRLGFDSTEKLIQLEKESKRLQIDRFLFNSTDRKQNSVNKRKMKSKMNRIYQRIKIEISNTRDYTLFQNNQIPRGTLSAIEGKQSNLITPNPKGNDRKGRWSSLILHANGKTLLVITAYQITETGGQGIYTIKAQLDKLDKQVKSQIEYRK